MRAAREEAPDLILLDLGLPGDGFLLMEELKADTYTASIPEIVLTGRDAKGESGKAYETGAALLPGTLAEGIHFLRALARQSAHN